MWRLEKTFRFEAAHYLPKHDGKCRRLHGHSFVGKVFLEGDSLVKAGPKSGMLIDFGEVGEIVGALVESGLDHYFLNDSTELDNPTSEELARWIYEQLKPALSLLVAVRVEETCTSACEYRP